MKSGMFFFVEYLFFLAEMSLGRVDDFWGMLEDKG